MSVFVGSINGRPVTKADVDNLVVYNNGSLADGKWYPGRRAWSIVNNMTVLGGNYVPTAAEEADAATRGQVAAAQPVAREETKQEKRERLNREDAVRAEEAAQQEASRAYWQNFSEQFTPAKMKAAAAAAGGQYYDRIEAGQVVIGKGHISVGSVNGGVVIGAVAGKRR